MILLVRRRRVLLLLLMAQILLLLPLSVSHHIPRRPTTTSIRRIRRKPGRRNVLQSLAAKARRRHAHLDRGLAHAVKGVAAGLGRRAFVRQVAEDRRRCQDGEVDVVEGEVAAYERRVP